MKDVNGELSPKQESNAIVPQEIYYLTTLKQLNDNIQNNADFISNTLDSKNTNNLNNKFFSMKQFFYFFF